MADKSGWTGTKVVLETFLPTLDSPMTLPVTAVISDSKTEFDDVSFTDIQGDPYLVAPSKIDIDGSRVIYTTLDIGFFEDVDDASGFNGFSLTFKALGQKSGMTIRAADIIPSRTTLEVDQSNISANQKALFVNVDGSAFFDDDTVTVELGFKIKGDGKANAISGMGGRDLLLGLGGKDILHGSKGRDDLVGGAGADQLYGGKGQDVFHFAAGDSERKHHDIIYDFAQKENDRIDLSGALKDGGALQFVGDDGFSASGAAEVRFDVRAKSTFIFADTNGNGRADITIELDGEYVLTAGDFEPPMIV